MGAFDKFKNADVMGVRNYIKEGKHVLLIRRTEQGMSKHPKKKDVEKTVVEFKVIASEPLEEGGNCMKVGEICSLVEMETSQGYAGNVLAFVAGVLGLPIDDMKADESFDEVFGNVFGAEQIFTNMLVFCTAQQVPTTSPDAKSDVYTAKTWEAVPASDYAQFNLVAPDGAYTPEAAEGAGDEAAA